MNVFLCSTFADLKAEREAVLSVVSQLQHQYQAMEFFGARPGRPLDTYLDEVRSCAIVVMVLSHLYGSLAPGLDISYTEAEYQEGYRHGKKCFVYIRDEDAPVPGRYHEKDPLKLERLTKLRTVLAERHTIVLFGDAADLARKVESDLAREVEKTTRPAAPEAAELGTFGEMFARELRVAADLQQQLLPKAAPAIAGFDIAARLDQARSVGGDYYDFFDYGDGRLGITIADVSGKGLPAGLMITSLQGRIHILAEHRYGPGQLVSWLNSSVAKNCPMHRFVTSFFALVNNRDGDLVYCNAGHNPPMVARRDGVVEHLPFGGPVLGIRQDVRYQEHKSHLEFGDALLLYTDGVTECPKAISEEAFGEDRLAAVLRDYRDRPAEITIKAIFSAIDHWASGAPFADDTAAVVIRRLRH
jgi:serine phosphatase RsbU (regulator of sigma subunit)